MADIEFCRINGLMYKSPRGTKFHFEGAELVNEFDKEWFSCQIYGDPYATGINKAMAVSYGRTIQEAERNARAICEKFCEFY